MFNGFWFITQVFPWLWLLWLLEVLLCFISLLLVLIVLLWTQDQYLLQWDNLSGIQPHIIYAEYIFKASVTCWQKPDISTEQQNNELEEILFAGLARLFPNNGVKESSWKWRRLKSKHSFPQPDLCLVQIKPHHSCKSSSATRVTLCMLPCIAQRRAS